MNTTLTARPATELPELDELVAAVRIFPLYEEYAARTERQIPVVLLTPHD
jgi:F420H(2)-dependent quinone reductase